MANHLIDPATGASIAEQVRSVTVLASTCVDAEIETKSLAVLLSRQEAAFLTTGTAAIAYHSGTIEVYEHAGTIRSGLPSNHQTVPAA